MKYPFVFAQPPVDQFGVRLLEKWYGAGCRVFLGWASTKNTSGANPAQDRQAQLDWRAAVRALGADAKYVDYVLPDWRTPATPADIAMMVNDPQCLGFMGMDEPNLSPPSDTTGKLWRVSLTQWADYWNPIIAADPNSTKLRIADFAGNKLSAAWGSYTGDDAKPYAAALTTTASNWHPRNSYGDTRADCDTYPAKAVRMLGRIAPTKPRWAIAECADEDLQNSFGRGPTPAEMQKQYELVMAESVPTCPVEGYGFFPQKPKPSAAHVFDNTTPAQFDAVKSIFAQFAGNPSPIPTPQPGLEARVAALEAWKAKVQAG